MDVIRHQAEPEHPDWTHFERTRQHFSEEEMVTLTLAVMAINAWNRLAISLRAVPGSYQVPARSPQSSPAGVASS